MELNLTSPLEGSFVRLEPLSHAHVDALCVAATEDRRSYEYTPVPDGAEDVRRHVDELLAERDAGLVVPFAQVDVASNRAVGMTRYMTLRARTGAPLPYAVEIGGTWLAASAQRSAINTEAKYLLLRHAFDEWNVARVDLKSDARNERSRSAIVRIGATFEGVLRRWQPSMVIGEEGLYRDSAMYSIIDSEWPIVKAHLELRLR